MSDPVLSVDNLSIARARRPEAPPLVSGVSLAVQRGQTVGLVGSSGSGKTLTMLACLGLLPTGLTAGGAITLLGQDVGCSPRAKLRALVGRRVGYVPQDPLAALDPMFTVGDQITVRDRLHGVDRRHRGSALREALRGLGLTRTPAASIRLAAEMLADVGIGQPGLRARQHPTALSGGMRQRALIAAAMRPKPDLVIADEPTTALDASLERQVLDLLVQDVKANGCALLLISHDLNLIAWYCDVAYVMHEGALVEHGTPAALFRDPRHSQTRALFAASPAFALDPRNGPGSRAASTSRPSMLQVDTVSRGYGSGRTRVEALKKVSLDVGRGEFVSLVGESGSGKSSLARHVLALERPDGGRIAFDGHDLARTPSTALRALRRRFQPVFQDPLSSLNPQWTVARSVTHPLRVHGLCGWSSQATALATLLDEVGLGFAAGRYPHELSGGQRQRVCIARALATRPDLVVADEALSGLDAASQRTVLAIFGTMRARYGTAFLFVSHDLRTVREISDRVCVMNAGEIVEVATPAALFANPRHPYTQRLLASLLPPRFTQSDPVDALETREDYPP